MDLLYRLASGAAVAVEHLTRAGVDHGDGCAYCVARRRRGAVASAAHASGTHAAAGDDARRAHPLATDLITSGATPRRKRLLAISDGEPGRELRRAMHYAGHAETVPTSCGAAVLRTAVARLCRDVAAGHSLVVLVEGVPSVDWTSLRPLERVTEPAASVLVLVAGASARDVPPAYASATYRVDGDGAVVPRLHGPAAPGAFRAVLAGGPDLLRRVDRLLAARDHRVTYAELLRHLPGAVLHVSRVGGDWHNNYVGMTLS